MRFIFDVVQYFGLYFIVVDSIERGLMKMKKIFIKTSKLLAILSIVAIVILVCYSFGATGETVDMPSFMSLFLFGVLFLFMVTLFIAVILDIIDCYKKDGFSFLKKYIAEIILVGVLFTLYEYFISKSGETWVYCFTQATIIVCTSRAGSNVIFAKQKNN